ncbi:uncharacterized protein LOC118565941 [Fundulus heteroclitus]|uniref:uncharacterized protein LOC118565941 n=1 Tax=Fundulus heteroclitus TaxID=8078 RepID=UPI00165B71AF|nr:uncharacterized protein LOC118565941 [Fundulus heteroclitus]
MQSINPATVEETQTVPPPAAAGVVSPELTSAVKTEPPAAEAAADQQPAASASSPAVDASLTVGEKLGRLLRPEQIHYLRENVIMSKKSYSLYTRLVLLSNLPKYHDGCYTENGIVNLLHEFGFYYKDTNIYVIPQACMAFVLMPSFRCAKQVFMASKNDSLTLNGSKLSVRIITSKIFMEPFEFYKSLMDLVGFVSTFNLSS